MQCSLLGFSYPVKKAKKERKRERETEIPTPEGTNHIKEDILDILAPDTNYIRDPANTI